MTHPTNPDAVKVKRDGERGWHWVARFDPTTQELYVETAAPDPFDHDGDGQPGGSLKGEQSTVAKGRRRAAK
jgi:hypothetical protein